MSTEARGCRCLFTNWKRQCTNTERRHHKSSFVDFSLLAGQTVRNWKLSPNLHIKFHVKRVSCHTLQSADKKQNIKFFIVGSSIFFIVPMEGISLSNGSMKFRIVSLSFKWFWSVICSHSINSTIDHQG